MTAMFRECAGAVQETLPAAEVGPLRKGERSGLSEGLPQDVR